MAQYVIQIIELTNQLIKCFEVTEQEPIPSVVPEGRVQGVMTNAVEFNAGVAFYDEHTGNSEFFWDGTNLTWQLRA